MISSLDIYQDNGVKIIKQNDFTFISGSKYSGKSYLLRFLIKQKWQSGFCCLIVTSDAAKGNLLQKHLGIYDLNKYSILLNDSTENQKKNFTKIKALQNEEKIEISKHDINSNSLIEQNILARISAYYNNLNQPLIQGKSFSELLTISAFDTNSYTNIHFNQIFDSGKFDFSEKEFTEVSQKVKTAYELQLKGENKNDVYFSRKSYTEKTAERSWTLIVQWLENSRIKILKSIELLSVLLNKQVNSIFELEWKELQQELVNADHYLLDCTSFLMQYKDFTPKTSLFGIDKKAKETNDKYLLAKQKIIYDYKKLINKLSSNNKIKDNYSLPDPESNNIEEIKQNLTEILHCNDKFETILYDSIKKEVKSLNFRNLRNSYTENLQNELKILFTVLNEGYAFKKWEDTAFSINKQIHFLENILEDLNEIEGQKLNFFNNYNWNSFLFSCDDKAIYIINKLNIYRPKNWLVFLKNWYIQNIILSNQKKVLTDIRSSVVDFEKINARKEELTRLKCSKIWQNKREIYLSKTEDKKNNHINQILFQSGTGIDDHELIENEDDFLITFFPVIIVTQNVMEKYKNLLAAKTDIIFFANITDYKDKLELSIPEQFDGKMVFFTEDKEYEDHLKKVLWKLSYQKKLVHVELNGYHQQGMIELLDMNNTERLYAARNLAFMMQTTNNNIKLFHIKNKIIFSALDDVLNKIMVKLLESHGIKEMKIIDTPFHLLVDSILEINNKQVLLIQNHLINYKNAENLKWQLFVLEKVRKSGIRVINFNTTELLNESVKSIREFISGI